jgi:hypothetical protein
VFPQYNWGYPAVLKNALDYLYREWRDKPASFITYGTRGGIKAAEQFTGVLQGLHVRVLDHAEAVITDVDDPGGEPGVFQGGGGQAGLGDTVGSFGCQDAGAVVGGRGAAGVLQDSLDAGGVGVGEPGDHPGAGLVEVRLRARSGLAWTAPSTRLT